MTGSPLDKLLKQLNSKKLADAVKEEFIKFGFTAYEYLITQLENPQLTDYQVINALTIIVSMRYIGEPTRAIDKVLNLTLDDRIRVRSVAANIAISLLSQSEQCGTPSFQLSREKLESLIKDSISMGLDSDSTSYAKDFLEKKI